MFLPLSILTQVVEVVVIVVVVVVAVVSDSSSSSSSSSRRSRSSSTSSSSIGCLRICQKLWTDRPTDQQADWLILSARSRIINSPEQKNNV